MKDNFKYIIISVILAAATFILGFYVSKVNSGAQNAYVAPVNGDSTEATQNNLINPSVTMNIGKHFIINFKPLKDQLTAIQKEYAQKTYIYFDYLNNASWIGLNERDNFTAASTVKVPLAMVLMKAVEDGKLKLTDSYALDDLDLDKNFGDLYKVGADQAFTIEELLKIMLEQSDNTAMHGIVNVFNKIGIDDPLAGVYDAMGWGIGTPNLLPDVGQTVDYGQINLKMLSNMFIALYNADYVNVEHSQQILNYLDNTPFNDKIEAGVPANISVAHKIGTSVDNETFADCGIIYAPSRNYLLCLASNGGNDNVASEFMAEISKAVYSYVMKN